MTATNGALVTQVRHLIDQAHAEGRHRPGRPTLVQLTGATDHEIRKALTELGTVNTNAGHDTALQDHAVGEHPQDPDTEPNTRDQPIGDIAHAGPIAPPATTTIADSGEQHTHPTPAGGRLVAWTGFVFGSVMSIAANVLHAWLPASQQPSGWSPGIPPQIGAAVWPVGLMLAVEALSRIRWPGGLGWGLARFGGAGAVALGSAVISYGHLRDVLLAWQYGPLAAAVGPLVLDGLMVVCGFALLANSLTSAGDTKRHIPTDRTS